MTAPEANDWSVELQRLAAAHDVPTEHLRVLQVVHPSAADRRDVEAALRVMTGRPQAWRVAALLDVQMGDRAVRVPVMSPSAGA